MTGETVNRAIDYIMAHIGEDISVEDVAAYCHFSKFYFSRIFKEETGESVYAFIKRVRLEQSAFKLKVERSRSIMDIGFDYGYSPSNYSTVFKQQLKESPADFRRSIFEKSISHPFYHTEQVELKSFEECKRLVTIENLPDMRVIYERMRGNYHEIGAQWDSFLSRYERYRSPEALLIERTYDDPAITDTDNCMYDLCMTAPEDCPLENITTLQGGKFAVYHFDGRAPQIYAAYQSFFNVWFPRSGYKLDERYSFDIYREIDCESAHFIMDFCFPVQ